MGGKCNNTYRIQLWCLALLILVLESQGRCSLNSEGKKKKKNLTRTMLFSPCDNVSHFWASACHYSLLKMETNVGLALLEFRAGVDSDPYGAFANWNPNDCDPCLWSGVQCVNDQVQML